MNRKFSELLLRAAFTKPQSHFNLALKNYSVWQRAASTMAMSSQARMSGFRLMSTDNNSNNINQGERIGININTGETVRQPA